MMTRPRLLMIDELSLGLAPITVERLMGMVRRINDSGTTVILVEQSLNRALSLADRCFFMERGEIRFEGPTTELMGRDDLLRPVFLGAASSGLG
jgi:branched-chain amino acid transport system ATP-binding protein